MVAAIAAPAPATCCTAQPPQRPGPMSCSPTSSQSRVRIPSSPTSPRRNSFSLAVASSYRPRHPHLSCTHGGPWNQVNSGPRHLGGRLSLRLARWVPGGAELPIYSAKVAPTIRPARPRVLSCHAVPCLVLSRLASRCLTPLVVCSTNFSHSYLLPYLHIPSETPQTSTRWSRIAEGQTETPIETSSYRYPARSTRLSSHPPSSKVN